MKHRDGLRFVLIILLVCLSGHCVLSKSLVIFGKKLVWCHYSSCIDRCGNTTVKQDSDQFNNNCPCDQFCINRGDCCIDYELACVHQTNANNPATHMLHGSDKLSDGNNSRILHETWFQYVRNNTNIIEKDLLSRVKWRAVQTCELLKLSGVIYDKNKKNLSDIDEVENAFVYVVSRCSLYEDSRCSHPNEADPIESTPVCNKQFIFKNIFCALCNNISDNISVFRSVIACIPIYAKMATLIWRQHGHEAYIFITVCCY